MEFRQSQVEDLDQVVRIAEDAKAFLRLKRRALSRAANFFLTAAKRRAIPASATSGFCRDESENVEDKMI